jgi:hypothetical protein
MQETPDSSQGGYIHRPDRHGFCFATAGAQFDLASVTSEKTKFNYARAGVQECGRG